MKHTSLVIALFMLVVSTGSNAVAFTAFVNADGNLSDWGVTPFSDWDPTEGAGIAYAMGTSGYPDYGTPSADDDVLAVPGGANVWQLERYDFEQLYAYVTPTELSLAMVTSYNWQDPTGYAGYYTSKADNYSGAPLDENGNWAGDDYSVDRYVDVAFEFNGGGDNDYYNYAVRMSNGQAELYYVDAGVPDPSGKPGTGAWESAYWFDTNDPVGFNAGHPQVTLLGSAEQYIKFYDPDLETDGWVGDDDYRHTWIYEVSFDLTGSDFASLVLSPNDTYYAHVSPWCGNDGLWINGGTGGTVGFPIPEPASLTLLSLCALGVGVLARRRKAT